MLPVGFTAARSPRMPSEAVAMLAVPPLGVVVGGFGAGCWGAGCCGCAGWVGVVGVVPVEGWDGAGFGFAYGLCVRCCADNGVPPSVSASASMPHPHRSIRRALL